MYVIYPRRQIKLFKKKYISIFSKVSIKTKINSTPELPCQGYFLLEQLQLHPQVIVQIQLF